jgi:tripartite-type tricarboxylate transporter receptor subunit TctC
MKKYKKSLIWIASALCLFVLVGAAYGAYPEKPITLVINSGPGSGIDILARFISAVIDKYKFLPQAINCENKAGGSSIVAMNYAYGKKGDPYVLMSVTSPFLLNNLFGSTPLSYRDFVPIARFSLDEHVLMVPYASPFKNIKELLDFAKKNPGVITVGVANAGGVEPLNLYVLEKALGIQFSIVPFNGGGPAMTALLGGHVSMSSNNPMEAIEMAAAKKVRILGAMTAERILGLEEVPTLKELGYNAVGYGMYRGIVAPPGFPAEAVKILDEAFGKFAKTEEFKKFHKDNAVIPAYQNSKDFYKYLADKSDEFEGALKEKGLLKKK